jgi:hypothetical protein
VGPYEAYEAYPALRPSPLEHYPVHYIETHCLVLFISN